MTQGKIVIRGKAQSDDGAMRVGELQVLAVNGDGMEIRLPLTYFCIELDGHAAPRPRWVEATIKVNVSEIDLRDVVIGESEKP